MESVSATTHKVEDWSHVDAWTGTLKDPAKCLWHWEPDRRSNFFFSPPAHLHIGWIVGCVVAIIVLIISISVCIFCWCCRRDNEKCDTISMKPLSSNYSDPSDALPPQKTRVSNYNYANPYDKRKSVEGVLSVKPTSKETKAKSKVGCSKHSKGNKKERIPSSYNYFTPFDMRNSEHGVLAVKSSNTLKNNEKEATKDRKNSKTGNNNKYNNSKNQNDVKLGAYIHVALPLNTSNSANRENSGKDAGFVSPSDVIDISESYADVSHKCYTNTPVRENSKRKQTPTPYSVVQLST